MVESLPGNLRQFRGNFVAHRPRRVYGFSPGGGIFAGSPVGVGVLAVRRWADWSSIADLCAGLSSMSCACPRSRGPQPICHRPRASIRGPSMGNLLTSSGRAGVDPRPGGRLGASSRGLIRGRSVDSRRSIRGDLGPTRHVNPGSFRGVDARGRSGGVSIRGRAARCAVGVAQADGDVMSARPLREGSSSAARWTAAAAWAWPCRTRGRLRATLGGPAISATLRLVRNSDTSVFPRTWG